ncbi:hypothetical protein [Hymenobacter coccineus]|uniref:hypothetical protein n=1 Tax=Hymenobacter coccineus TaxID=1908235 RepID=UPI000F7A6320|nr:hypothetical protein [Hymenobacter coccineus]
MNPNVATSTPLPPSAVVAVEKFLEMNDDLPALSTTTRRMFFEFLRTGPTLTPEEVEHLHALGDLLAALGQAGAK